MAKVEYIVSQVKSEATAEHQNHFQCPTESRDINAAGRPRINVTPAQIDSQRNIHSNWDDAAKQLGVSRGTLYRRRVDYHMGIGHDSKYSRISDADLDQLLRKIMQVSPNAGERKLKDALQERGIRVQRERLRCAIRRTDPIGRFLRRTRATVKRSYTVEGRNEVNELWHMDGNYKLIRWRFVIHGAVEGYSRLITYLKCATNNYSSTVLRLFAGAVHLYGLPSRVKSDMKTESRVVERYVAEHRGTGDGRIITCLSDYNRGIEKLWSEVNRRVNSHFREIFLSLEESGDLDTINEIDMCCLHFIYLPLINKALDELILQYNKHPIRTADNQSPLQMWRAGTPGKISSHSVDVDSILTQDVDSKYGSGDTLSCNDSDSVKVPQNRLDVSDDLQKHLLKAVRHIDSSDHFSQYLCAREALQRWYN